MYREAFVARTTMSVCVCKKDVKARKKLTCTVPNPRMGMRSVWVEEKEERKRLNNKKMVVGISIVQIQYSSSRYQRVKQKHVFLLLLLKEKIKTYM